MNLVNVIAMQELASEGETRRGNTAKKQYFNQNQITVFKTATHNRILHKFPVKHFKIFTNSLNSIE